jgi:hypothetical protein
MRNRLFGLLASTALVFGACQGATSPSPSTQASTAESPSPAASESPSAAASPTPVDYDQLLYAAYYQARAGSPGV